MAHCLFCYYGYVEHQLPGWNTVSIMKELLAMIVNMALDVLGLL